MKHLDGKVKWVASITGIIGLALTLWFTLDGRVRGVEQAQAVTSESQKKLEKRYDEDIRSIKQDIREIRNHLLKRSGE